MGKVLVVYFSNSGCTKHVLDTLLSPLVTAGHDVRWHALSPVPPYPFPWTHPQFYETFPEALAGDLPCLAAMGFGDPRDVDLVVLGWQVWFLRPSPPVQAFLRSRYAEVIRGKRIISVVCCRQMWRTAHRQLLQAVTERGGRITDNVVVTHQGGTRTLVTTPRMLISGGNKTPAGDPLSLLDPEAMGLQPRIGAMLSDAAADWTNVERGSLISLETARPAADCGLAEWIGNGYMVTWAGIARLIGGRRTWSRSISAFIFATLLVLLIPLVIAASLLTATVAQILRSRQASELDTSNT
jgi:hypothetical protein